MLDLSRSYLAMVYTTTLISGRNPNYVALTCDETRLDPKTYTAVAIASFEAFARAIELTPDEQATALGITLAALRRFRCTGRLQVGKETRERAGYLLRIIAALHSMCSGEVCVGEWLRAEHQEFDRKSPIARILEDIDGMIDVLTYVEAAL